MNPDNNQDPESNQKGKLLRRWAIIPAELKASLIITPLLFGLAFLLGFMQIANRPAPMGPAPEVSNEATDSITPEGAPTPPRSRSPNRPTYVVYASSPSRIWLVRAEPAVARPDSTTVIREPSSQPIPPDQMDQDGVGGEESKADKRAQKVATKEEKNSQKEADKAAKERQKCQKQAAQNSQNKSQKPFKQCQTHIA